MSIGIFGDSFTASNEEGTWPWHLSRLLNIPVRCYGIKGSSLFNAYQRMKKYANLHDIVLLRITDSGRLYFNDDAELHFNTAETAALVINDPRHYSEVTVRKAKAAAQYYKELSVPTFDRYVHKHLIKDIAEEFPSIIMLNDREDFLGMVATREAAYFNVKGTFIDLRPNHISKTNSLIVAEHVVSLINKSDDGFDIKKIIKPIQSIDELFDIQTRY